MTYAGRHQGTVRGCDGSRRKEATLRCEAIADMATWNAAQKALTNRPKRGPVAQDNQPLLAKLLCARCDDSAMYRILTYGTYHNRCAGRGAQRKGCGNMVNLAELEHMVNVRMLEWHSDPHTVVTVIPGQDWTAEIADTVQAIRELDPLADDYDSQLKELRAALEDYKFRPATADRIEKIPTGKTIGQHYISLSHDERRDYLAKNHEIRVEKLATGKAGLPSIRVFIDGRDDERTSILGMDYRYDADMQPRQDNDEVSQNARSALRSPAG
jgi:hypothetical protein